MNHGNFLVAQVSAARIALYNHIALSGMGLEERIVEMSNIRKMDYGELVLHHQVVIGKMPCPANY